MLGADQVCKAIVEHAADLIYILDEDLAILWLNHHSITVFAQLLRPESSAEAKTARAHKDPESFFVGRRLDELFQPSDVAFVRRKMDQVLASGTPLSYEHAVTRNAWQMHFSTKLIPIRSPKGQTHQILGITRDVTEKHELDQQIYNAEKLASIGNLAAGVAHEINNPLAVILGFTELLLDRFAPDSPEYKDLKLIESNANHAKEVVARMLGFARVTEGMRDTVDVRASLDLVVGILRHTLSTKNIDFVLEVPEGLPMVRGDPREYQQVVFNLVDNALAAMVDGRGRLTIVARSDEDGVCVEVSDTGAGIPDRIKPRVFDPFFTTKKVGEGTGLGLSLCYGIVRKHGGRIQFTSVSAEDMLGEPTGTTFTVLMPIAQPGSARGEQ